MPQNESAVAEQGEDVLARIAQELVSVMRRDVRTDWMAAADRPRPRGQCCLQCCELFGIPAASAS
ncbi:MAG: hypothetical protein ACRDRX_19935 [Pseudonocardiaceae bacterium]